MQPLKDRAFDLRVVLDAARTPFAVADYRPRAVIFSQGDPCDSVMYIETGSVRLAVIAPNGKEAILGFLGAGAFLSEEALAGHAVRLETATASTATTVLVVAKSHMIQQVHAQHALSDRLIAHILARNIRLEEDLTDQLFNSAEKRVARTLLLLAGYGKRDQSRYVLPQVTQEIIAGMVGTTRSRVNLFMNKFKKRGFIEEDNGALQVKHSLLSVVVEDNANRGVVN